ncbi:MAG: CHAD domain-containing protein, partial [Actinomycetota bacterium]
MDGTEIELKLACEPAVLARLRRHPAVAVLVEGPVRSRTLVSQYFDTADLALAAAGLSLRIRRKGRQRIQTLKTEGSRSAGLFTRREWESPATGERPGTDFLAASNLPELAAPDLSARLQPVFSTKVRRTTLMLAGEDWRAELALDEGEIVAGDARRPIAEAELELLAGPPARLHDLARRLAEDLPLHLLTRSKSDRGYALAAGRGPQPVKARPPTLSEEMTAAQAFQAIGRACLAHLLANQEALLAGDGEAVHQMRVALRRLRSAVRLFAKVVDGPATAKALDDIRWLLRHLGPARDADVFVTEMLAPVVEAHPGDRAMAALDSHWRRRRDADMAAARDAVASMRFTALVLDLGAWIEAGRWNVAKAATRAVVPFAAKVLARRHRKIMKAGDGRLARLPPDELHQVRILGKQLRYGCEFFAGLLPGKAARPFIAGLAELQDALGRINDIATALARLEAGPKSARPAADRAAAWHGDRRPGLVEEADKAWKRWRRL